MDNSNKSLNIISIKLIVVIVILSSFFVESGCSQMSTPKEYLYNDTTSKFIYDTTKHLLERTIKAFIEKRAAPYYPNEFDKKTEIFIDTILFNPKKNKLITLVITKNSNDKLLSKGNKDEYHYSANCFIGTKDTICWRLKWFNTLNLIDYDSYKDISDGIRNIYFNELATLKDKYGASIYEYNANDIRFWQGPVWKIF